MLKHISIGLVSAWAVLAVGCDSTGGKNVEIKVDPIPIPDSQKKFEDNTTKEAYLEAVKKARSEGHDCGHYKKDKNGNEIKDKDGNHITIHEGLDEDFRPAIKDDPLKWNEKLYKAAYEHNVDMSKSGKISHTGSGSESDHTAKINHPGRGSTYKERVLGNGYKYSLLKENLTVGTNIDSAKKAVEMWLNSAGHCKNLMDANVTDMGMSHVYEENSTYKNFWTQDLAKPGAKEKGIF